MKLYPSSHSVNMWKSVKVFIFPQHEVFSVFAFQIIPVRAAMCPSTSACWTSTTMLPHSPPCMKPLSVRGLRLVRYYSFITSHFWNVEILYSLDRAAGGISVRYMFFSQLLRATIIRTEQHQVQRSSQS